MSRDHQSSSLSEPQSRRRLLTVVGAAGAAVAATILPRGGTRAGHGAGTDLQAMHLGEENHADTVTELFTTIPFESSAGAAGFQADVNRGRGIIGTSSHGVGVSGHSFGGDNPEFPIVGVEGTANENGIGVRGRSHTTDDPGISGSGAGVEGASGSGPGVDGFSDGGPGVRGNSGSGPGVSGSSDSGNGGEFSSNSGFALVAGQSHIGGSSPGFMLGVGNDDEGADGGGLYATTHGGKPAVEGDAFEGESGTAVGVQGVSGGGDTFGQGSGIGVQGISGSGHGVEGISDTGTGVRGVHTSEDFGFGVEGESAGVGVHGLSEVGTGVAGDSQQFVGVQGQAFNHTGVVGWGNTGVLGTGSGEGAGQRAGVAGAAPGEIPGVMAISAVPGDIQKEPPVPDGIDQLVPDPGIALQVIGRARFSSAGSDTVAQGDSSKTVLTDAMTDGSHVSVTLSGDPGSRQLLWVERVPGGFTVHMTSAPPPQRIETPFTYLIVEPG